MGPRPGPAALQHLSCPPIGWRVGALAAVVDVSRWHDDQPGFLPVGNISGALRCDVDGGEPIRRWAAVVLQPPDDFDPHILGVKPFGVVAGGAGGVGLGIEPVLFPEE